MQCACVLLPPHGTLPALFSGSAGAHTVYYHSTIGARRCTYHFVPLGWCTVCLRSWLVHTRACLLYSIRLMAEVCGSGIGFECARAVDACLNSLLHWLPCVS